MYAQDNILCQFGPKICPSVQQLISQPILIHFWWELYHLDPNFDAYGLYTKRAINTLSSLASVQQPPPMVMSSSKSPIQAYKHKLKPETPDFDKYRPYFGWVNVDTIRDTFKHTT